MEKTSNSELLENINDIECITTIKMEAYFLLQICIFLIIIDLFQEAQDFCTDTLIRDRGNFSSMSYVDQVPQIDRFLGKRIDQ